MVNVMVVVKIKISPKTTMHIKILFILNNKYGSIYIARYPNITKINVAMIYGDRNLKRLIFLNIFVFNKRHFRKIFNTNAIIVPINTPSIL